MILLFYSHAGDEMAKKANVGRTRVRLRERVTEAVIRESKLAKLRGSGFESRQGQGFSLSYEVPNYYRLLGAGASYVFRMRR
jgi:hypothetical protein